MGTCLMGQGECIRGINLNYFTGDLEVHVTLTWSRILKNSFS